MTFKLLELCGILVRSAVKDTGGHEGSRRHECEQEHTL